MNSVILQLAASHLRPLLLLLSLFVLYRGHNEPGGGFLGGLMGASGYIIYAMAYGVESTSRKLLFQPLTFLGIGLLLAMIAGILPVLQGKEILTGLWTGIPLPGDKVFKLGTPLLFDAGVYFTVFGVLLTIMFAIKEEDEEWR
jgi:multicomponent Na+:H+ antiporter subunit B